MDPKTENRIICMRSDAFYALLDQVVDYVRSKSNLPEPNQWVDSETAMKILNIRSRTTLQTLRDTGKIRFSQPTKKAILFDRFSLLEYIEGHVQERF